MAYGRVNILGSEFGKGVSITNTTPAAVQPNLLLDVNIVGTIFFIKAGTTDTISLEIDTVNYGDPNIIEDVRADINVTNNFKVHGNIGTAKVVVGIRLPDKSVQFLTANIATGNADALLLSDTGIGEVNTLKTSAGYRIVIDGNPIADINNNLGGLPVTAVSIPYFVSFAIYASSGDINYNEISS